MKWGIYTILFLLTLFSVQAFEISSPQGQIYNTTLIDMQIMHNETLDSITYNLGEGVVAACENCSQFNTTLNLSEGNYTLNAFGYLLNDTFNATVLFIIDLEEIIINETNQTTNETNQTNDTTTDFSLNIKYPSSIVTGNYTAVFAESNMTLEYIKVWFDNVSDECTNCSIFNKTYYLDEGNYTLKVEGKLNNITKEAYKNFTVDFEDMTNETNQTNNTTNQTTNVTGFSLEIKYPSSTVNSNNTRVNVVSNITLDHIKIWFDGVNDSCENCSEYNETYYVGEGAYQLKAEGKIGNNTKTIYKNFTVDYGDNETDDNETDDDKNETYDPRFDTGFEKLPKMLEDGQLTDSELADIIRNNKLNPGVLNRLIKTGMLGNESLNAIVDTQFTPPGIFKKLLSWIGFKVETTASLIAENYNLEEKIAKKIVDKEELPKVRTKVMNEVKTIKESKANPGQAKKDSNAAKESTKEISSSDIAKGNVKIPPGQAKKQSDDNGSGKIPPGQAKKNK